jgi:uncharacterized protein YeaO (DUF488 family)
VPISLKRVYSPALPEDGFRVLVERLWPRGVSKGAAAVDLWTKGLAPSTALRRWFAHDPQRFAEFRKRYLAELGALDAEGRSELAALKERARSGPVSLVFSSRELRFNNAVVLKEFLESELS